MRVGVVGLALFLAGCSHSKEATYVQQWPSGQPKPTLVGFWKDHCEDDFGLKIEPAGGDLYSISFCGPGGCFEPGTYRPNSPIFGDHAYRVVDPDTIEVRGGAGFLTYYRCEGPAKK